jgi:hypothetical protein
MAHRFKPLKRVSIYRPKRTDKVERELRFMGSLIRNPIQLEEVLLQTKAEARDQLRERLRPYLPFKFPENPLAIPVE